MRIDSSQGSPVFAASAATAAFQVAVVQQKQFEETLERVSEKQDEAVKETVRKAERAEDVVDVSELETVVESSAPSSSDDGGGAPAPDLGSNVNVSV